MVKKTPSSRPAQEPTINTKSLYKELKKKQRKDNLKNFIKGGGKGMSSSSEGSVQSFRSNSDVSNSFSSYSNYSSFSSDDENGGDYRNDDNRANRPRVHFFTTDETDFQVTKHEPLLTEITLEDRRAIWFTKEEIQSFHKEHIDKCADYYFKQDFERMRDPDSHNNFLTTLFKACCDTRKEPGESRSNKPTSVLNRKDEEYFLDFFYRAEGRQHSRLGLERALVPVLQKDELQRRVNLLHLCAEVKEYAESNGTLPTKMAGVLARECAAQSRPSRIFAQHLGQALEAALENSRKKE